MGWPFNIDVEGEKYNIVEMPKGTLLYYGVKV